jgi:hypothetical protein
LEGGGKKWAKNKRGKNPPSMFGKYIKHWMVEEKKEVLK